MTKVKKEEEVKVPFILVNYLTEKINNLNVPTYGDIQKFKKLQESFSSVSNELNDKMKDLLDEYKVTEVKPEDENFEEINKKYQEILKTGSSVSRKTLQVFSKSEFEKVYNGSNLSVQDALTIEYWLVK